jgi:hypothetical protein
MSEESEWGETKKEPDAPKMRKAALADHYLYRLFDGPATWFNGKTLIEYKINILQSMTMMIVQCLDFNFKSIKLLLILILYNIIIRSANIRKLAKDHKGYGSAATSNAVFEEAILYFIIIKTIRLPRVLWYRGT